MEGEVNTTRATRELIIFLKQYVKYRMRYSMQYVQTGIYSQVELKLCCRRRCMGSTACSTQYGAVYAHSVEKLI